MFSEKSALNKNWITNQFDKNITKIIKNKYEIHESLAKFILNRGYDLTNIEELFNNKIKNSMPNPFILKDMDIATDLIIEAIEKKLRIAILGDYDVDGISSIAILVKFLKNFSENIEYYMPDRYEDGYGINMEIVKKIYSKIDLILIVDNGTLAINEIDYLKNKNVKVIVIDHHKVGSSLPRCDSLINPFRMEDESGLNYLCSAGLVYLFIVATCKKMKEYEKNYKIPDLLELLDFVAMATICDMMPVLYLNRCFINQGVIVANKKPNVAINAMKEVFGIQQISYETFAFTFGPAINAASRMDYGNLALKLMINEDSLDAKNIAQKLKEINQERQNRENIDIDKVIMNMEIKDNFNLIFEGGDYIIKGINGIIASRLKELYNRPVLIYALDKNTNIATASGRSIVGVDLAKIILLALSRNLIIKGGGHGMAIGFSFDINKKNELNDFFITEIENQLKHRVYNDTISFDDKLKLTDINDNFLNQIINFSPYGIGFLEPVFVFEYVIINSIKKIGKNNNHIMIEVFDGFTKKINAFVYKINNNPLYKFFLDNKNTPISIMANVKNNIYKDKNYPSLIILDAKK